DGGYHRDATTGDAYLLQTNADGTLELVPDPRVDRLDTVPIEVDDIPDEPPTGVKPRNDGFVQPSDPDLSREVVPVKLDEIADNVEPLHPDLSSEVVPVKLDEIADNVEPLDPDLSREVPKKLDAFEPAREWENNDPHRTTDDPHRTTDYPQPQSA